MKITELHTDQNILQELGARIAGLRLARNLTQAALAKEAGVSRSTVERLESGAVALQLSGFLRVCRILGQIDGLNKLVPEPGPSPRQRASTRKAAAGRPGPGPRHSLRVIRAPFELASGTRPMASSTEESMEIPVSTPTRR
jgi:transcriptional regulator with XRE-family HTH domain